MSAIDRALYLHTRGGAIFAFMHGARGPRRERAVLICPPFGWEDMCSYRSRRDWAEHLSGEGFSTLRIDLPSSGDSAGSPRDPARLDAWTNAVRDAAVWLAESTGAHVVALGIGLGGMVAFRSAMGGAPIEELVLWSVPARGRRLLRELRAFSALEVANVRHEHDTVPAPAAESEDGEVLANGYLISAETARDLDGLDLAQLVPAPSTRLRRALLLGRDGLKIDEALLRTLERHVTTVEAGDGPGFGAMMAEPQDALPPTKVFAEVSSWLLAGEGLQPSRPAAEDESVGASRPSARAGQRVVESSSSLELSSGGADGDVRETPIYMEGGAGRLFGVLAEPLGEPAGLTAVLMNAGPQRRTGPNRMWVEIARRWASRGVPTLRVDVEAIGDSDGDAAALVRVASLYTPEYVTQARSVLDVLAARGLPPRFLMLGLCSGAYWSAHAAIQDERIASLIMLNPRALIWDEWVHAVRRTRELRERLLLGSTWRKVLRGEITLARHLEVARAILRGALRAPLRARPGQRTAPTGQPDTHETAEPLGGMFDSLRERDQRALLLFTGSEPLHQELLAGKLFDRLGNWPNLDLQTLGVDADTHTLTPLWLQQQVHDLVDRAMEEELKRLPEHARSTIER